MAERAPTGSPPPADPDERRRQLLTIVRDKGYQRHSEPLRLASGELSHDFVDGKAACANGHDLELACRIMWELAREEAPDTVAVGGLTLGADHFSHGIALLAGIDWFTVRKQEKGRGTNQRIEGRRLAAGDRVLLVDDVVTTGGSIAKAHEAILATGAEVAIATTLLDRGHSTRHYFEQRGVAYRPVFTFADLGIEPVGGQPVPVTSS